MLFLLSLCACAEFSFNQSSLSSPFSVTVLGITGGADVSLDTFLFDGSEATVHWADEPDETGYDVRIFEDDGITIRCSVSGLPADTISHTFAGCPLIEGQAYFAVVEKIAPVVATSVVEPTARSKALNKISSFFGGNENQAFAPYGFLYPAIIRGCPRVRTTPWPKNT